MSHSIASTFPLEAVATAQLHGLCQALWHWKPCPVCGCGYGGQNQTTGSSCVSEDCSWNRLPRLEPFFNFYKEVTGFYVPELLLPDTTEAIRSHEDLFDIIEFLCRNPSTPRAQLSSQYFSARAKDDDGDQPPLSDQHRAFNLAVRVLAMVSCRIESQTGGLLESGEEPSVWRSDKTLLEFFSLTFPVRDHPTLNEVDVSSLNIKAELMARRLKKVAGLSFKGTDDLRNHLRLDQKTGVVEIYHHTSVLKEDLMASKAEPTSGCIPRQLALETLDSLQKILFPLDPQSQSLLRSLVSKQSLDPDCLRFGSARYRREGEEEVTYRHWGSRLMDLYDEIENPKPRGLLERWVEQNSKARHVMMATLVGVFIAIVLGALGLAVAILQAWISYETWKHPMPLPDGSDG